MKVKASVLVSSVAVFRQIDMTAMKLSVAHQLRKIIQEAESAIGDFEARRIKIAEKYGTLNEEKTQYLFDTDEDRENFQKELTELMDDEIDIKITPVPVELVDDYITIAPAAVEMVSWAVSGLD